MDHATRSHQLEKRLANVPLSHFTLSDLPYLQMLTGGTCDGVTTIYYEKAILRLEKIADEFEKGKK